MGLLVDDIFEADPDGEVKPKRSYLDGLDATMHGGYYDAAANKPATVEEWLFRAGEPTKAAALAELFGGTPVEQEESTKEFFIELFSAAPKVLGALTPDGLYVDFKQWSNGKLVHHCTGTKFLSHPFNDELVGEPCGCPRGEGAIEEMKERANAGMGPKPNIEFTFQLMDDESMTVKYSTGSWGLMKRIRHIYRDIERKGGGGLAVVEFKLEQKDFGKGRKPIVPEVRVLRSYNDAVAD